jgi:hypothetical protein
METGCAANNPARLAVDASQAQAKPWAAEAPASPGHSPWAAAAAAAANTPAWTAPLRPAAADRKTSDEFI